MSPEACFSSESGLVSCANGINKWEHLVLFLQMSCQGKHIFYCLVSTSFPYSGVLTAVPKLWFAFQCQSGNNVVEILDVPWSAAWTSLPFIGCLTCLTGQGISHKATSHFPALLNASQVRRRATVSALFDFISLWKKSVLFCWFYLLISECHLNASLRSSGINTSSHTAKARFCKSDEY